MVPRGLALLVIIACTAAWLAAVLLGVLPAVLSAAPVEKRPADTSCPAAGAGSCRNCGEV